MNSNKEDQIGVIPNHIYQNVIHTNLPWNIDLVNIQQPNKKNNHTTNTTLTIRLMTIHDINDIVQMCVQEYYYCRLPMHFIIEVEWMRIGLGETTERHN